MLTRHDSRHEGREHDEQNREEEERCVVYNLETLVTDVAVEQSNQNPDEDMGKESQLSQSLFH